ncbi:MAG: HTH domain-containing protein, partial [Bacteroidales bacterium]|nr:HTH domain-containing protein [Bacteroidales bacterium]
DGTKDGQDGTKDGQDVTKEPNDGTKDFLTDRQLQLLNLMKEGPTYTSFDLAQKLGISIRTLRREISILQGIGLIKRQGGRKDGSWELLP